MILDWTPGGGTIPQSDSAPSPDPQGPSSQTFYYADQPG